MRSMLTGQDSKQAVKRLRSTAIRVAREWIAAFVYGLTRTASSLSAAAVLHPEGDYNDWHPHVDVVVRCDGEARLWVDRDAALSALARDWTTAIRAPRRAVVHYEYRRKPGEIRHALRYSFRAWPTWAGWVTRVVYAGPRIGDETTDPPTCVNESCNSQRLVQMPVQVRRWWVDAYDHGEAVVIDGALRIVAARKRRDKRRE